MNESSDLRTSELLRVFRAPSWEQCWGGSLAVTGNLHRFRDRHDILTAVNPGPHLRSEIYLVNHRLFNKLHLIQRLERHVMVTCNVTSQFNKLKLVLKSETRPVIAFAVV